MADKKVAPKFYVATTGFLIPAPKGRSRGRLIKGGQIVAAKDPIVKKYSQFFEPAEDVVEQATAAPGERRATLRKKTLKVGE